MCHRATRPLVVLGVGLAVMIAARAFAPVAFPLFDGVIVADPYRYLSPPPGGEGSPTSAAATTPIEGGKSPAFAVYTTETPPQAELLAHGGELAISAGSRSVTVTIDPIAPLTTAGGATVAGNVYRVVVTDQDGGALALAPGQTMTLAMRGPAGISADASIAHFVDGAWQPLLTEPSGLQDLFLANAAAFGDFALLGAVPANPSGLNPALLIAAIVVAGLIALLGLRFAGTPRAGRSSSSGTRPPPRRTARTCDKR